MGRSPRQSSRSDASVEPELSFEQALAELEKVVVRMESGKLSLEQALAEHRRGLQLAKLCQARLAAAQQQVSVLEGDVLKPLAASESEPHAGE